MLWLLIASKCPRHYVNRLISDYSIYYCLWYWRTCSKTYAHIHAQLSIFFLIKKPKPSLSIAIRFVSLFLYSFGGPPGKSLQHSCIALKIQAHAQLDQENYSHLVSIMMGYKHRGDNTAIKLDLRLTISETRSSLLWPYILKLLRITVLLIFLFLFLLYWHLKNANWRLLVDKIFRRILVNGDL